MKSRESCRSDPLSQSDYVTRPSGQDPLRHAREQVQQFRLNAVRQAADPQEGEQALPQQVDRDAGERDRQHDAETAEGADARRQREPGEPRLYDPAGLCLPDSPHR